jgi:hypothetical protein
VTFAIDGAPAELYDGITEFFPDNERDNALRIAYLESGWDAFALSDTTGAGVPCGTELRTVDGVAVFAERSVGYFQINSCNFPGWEWQRLYNARHNCGTAHLIWAAQGWQAWYFSAKQLGLI